MVVRAALKAGMLFQEDFWPRERQWKRMDDGPKRRETELERRKVEVRTMG